MSENVSVVLSMFVRIGAVCLDSFNSLTCNESCSTNRHKVHLWRFFYGLPFGAVFGRLTFSQA